MAGAGPCCPASTDSACLREEKTVGWVSVVGGSVRWSPRRVTVSQSANTQSRLLQPAQLSLPRSSHAATLSCIMSANSPHGLDELWYRGSRIATKPMYPPPRLRPARHRPLPLAVVNAQRPLGLNGGLKQGITEGPTRQFHPQDRICAPISLGNLSQSQRRYYRRLHCAHAYRQISAA
eukprot:COSAG01_NODE_6585_length_3592_cov_3.100487_1_plen_178_part_00